MPTPFPSRRFLRARRGALPAILLGMLLGAGGCSAPAGDASPTPPVGPESPSPTRQVEILVDDVGIPHVFAPDDDSLFFAAGYMMAVDRLYQMEMLRRFALGRLAEVLGEDGLTRDLQARTFDFPRWGRQDCAVMATDDPERLTLLHAWVEGINARIEEVRAGDVPPPFGYDADGWDFLPELWEKDDPCIVLKGAGFALDKTLEFEYAVSLLYSLYPDAMASIELLKPAQPVYSLPEADRPTRAGARAPAHLESGDTRLPVSARPSARAREAARWSPPEALRRWVQESPEDARALLEHLLDQLRQLPSASGSNNWAVDGRFTDPGRPFLAGDPHLGFDFFGAPYPLHLNSADAGGSYNVAGFAYPGTPGIAIGHNAHVAWSPTSAFGDVMDLWSVELQDGQALVGGQWHPIVERLEEILVRDPGGPVGQGHVESRIYQEIDGFGVLVPGEVLGAPFLPPLLNQWTGFSARPARWFMELNRVSDLDDFEAAVDRMGEMNYNFIGADSSGISLRVGVNIPVRQDVSGARAPWRTLDAADPLTLWPGEMLALEQLPRSRGEVEGFLVTANNDPFGFTDNGLIDDDPWFYGAFFDPGYRAHRITTQLKSLTASGNVRLEDMLTLQMDTRSTLADNLLPLLSVAWSQVGIDPSLSAYAGDTEVEAVVDTLLAWDRRMTRDAPGALLFNAWLQLLTAAVLKDDIPSAYDFAVSLQAIYVMKVADLALRGVYPEGDYILQEGRNPLLLAAARATADWLLRHYGSVDTDTISYSDFKVTGFDDAFGYRMPVFSRPSDGGEDTICVSQNIQFDPRQDVWVSTYTSVERMVVTFDGSGMPVAYVNYPVGPTADPDSGDTARANEDYLEGNYGRFAFDRAEIEERLRTRTWLQVP